MKLFYKHLVVECQREHIRLLCCGWPVALIGLLTGSVVFSILGIVLLVMAFMGRPEELEINDEQSSGAEEGRQEAV